MSGKPVSLSIIVPCYNEEAAIPLFYDALTTECAGGGGNPLSYEVIFVDDGSIDRTLYAIKQLSNKDTHVSFISFSRNFGKVRYVLWGYPSMRHLLLGDISRIRRHT